MIYLDIETNTSTDTVYAGPTCPWYGCKAKATGAGDVTELDARTTMQHFTCADGHTYYCVGGN